MAVELFGFTIGRTQKEKEQQDRVSFTLPQSEDGAIDVAGTPGGAYATYLDMEGSAKNEAELILRYRSMALFPEAEIAIDDIVNDAVVSDRETVKLLSVYCFLSSPPLSGDSTSIPVLWLPLIVAVTASATEAAPSVETRAVPINSSFFIITPFELMNIH